MKLTIIRLQHFSDQDRIDLGKIWPSQDLAALTLDDNQRIYAARFNGKRPVSDVCRRTFNPAMIEST